MILKFNECQLLDIEGNPLPGVLAHKILANAIYMFTKNLDMVEIAVQMNKEEEVELTQEQVEDLKKIINDPQPGFLAFTKKTLLDFIKNAK